MGAARGAAAASQGAVPRDRAFCGVDTAGKGETVKGETVNLLNEWMDPRGIAPWTLIEGNDKNFARVKVLTTLADRTEDRLKK